MSEHPALADGPVCLDYSATTPVDPRVAEAMSPYLTRFFGNLSSGHAYGSAPRDALEEAPRVVRVNYRGLVTDEAKKIVDEQMRGGGGMLSAVLDAIAAQTAAVVDQLRLFAIAPSLGGDESLVTQPITATHHGLDAGERARRGIADIMIRLSIGLEEADDLISDLAQALATS